LSQTLPGEVGAQLDEGWPEVGVVDVEVVDGHRPIGLVEAEVDRLAVLALAAGVAHEHLLDLLGSDDSDDPGAALALGGLEVRTDVIELAVVPASAIRPLQVQ
jgi:hypothetical protein